MSRYIDVTVDIDMGEFDDQDLIDELENRGWYVGEEKGWTPNEELTEDEILCILKKFQDATPGTIEYFIYEKLKR